MIASDPPNPIHVQLRRAAGTSAHPILNIPDDRWQSLTECAANKPQWLEMTPSDQLHVLNSGVKNGLFFIRFPPFQTLTISEPGRWNLEGDRSFAARHPLSWNYLRPESPNYWFKMAQKQVYLRRIEPWLAVLPSNATVLEVGGGIGRFSIEWLRRGFQVTHTDPNADALVMAMEHLTKTAGTFSLWHLGAERLSPLSNDEYDMVSAFEVFCYLSKPMEGLQEAMRVLQPGGLLFLSVETTTGASARGKTDSETPPDTFSAENDVWVHLYTQQRLEDELKRTGFEVESVQGVHYLLDGPHGETVDFDRLDEPEIREKIAEQDRIMDDGQHGIPRAILAVARKPHTS